VRNKLIAIAILACSGLSVAAAPALGETKGTKQVLVCKDVKKSNNTGTVVGAVGGGILGNVVAGHGNKTAGTVIGAGVGAVAGTRSPSTTTPRNPTRNATTSIASYEVLTRDQTVMSRR